MARHWHLEHSDGQEWTQDELNRVVKTLRFGRYRSYRKTGTCQFQCINRDGQPFLLDTFGEWWPMADYSDMVVKFVSDQKCHLEHTNRHEWTRKEMDSLVENRPPTFLMGMDEKLWIGDNEGFDSLPKEHMERLDVVVKFDG